MRLDQVPDQDGGQHAHAIQRPMQRDGRQEAAATPAQPGKDKSGDRGGDHRPGYTGYLRPQAHAEQSGKADIARRQPQGGGDMPEAEQQRADCRHAPKAPGTRHGSVQHTTERKFSGITVCNGISTNEASSAPETVVA